ncbi:MAG: restriction endonuclease subunit S, partial [Bacillus sp. (in: Bacteria)]|nr:restriction endonuclease subunit S [Bacillus sp. (in: firmicutes)]
TDTLQRLKALFRNDFFDLVIVDECHRGSAKKDSNWRKILEYFSDSAQIGMTATPKETRYISNIPESWKWVHLAELCTIVTGKRDANFGSPDGEYLFFTCAKEPIHCKAFSFSGESLLLAGNGDIGNISYYWGQFEAYQRTYVLQPYIEDGYLKYLFYHLQSNWIQYNLGMVFGTAIPYIRLGNVQNYPVALPPLAEQKRIVAKIEELLPYIDRYEKAWNHLEDFNKRFPADMQKSILQLAIQGKLVEQRPEEGTGEELYKQIKEETASLIAAKVIKEEKLQDAIDESEIPFDIPANWTWVRFGNLGRYKKGPFGSALTKGIFVPKSNDTVKVYEQKNAIQKDASLGEYYITKEYFESKMTGFEVQPGDIIVSCAGTIGETFVLPNGIEKGIINQALMRMRLFNPIYVPYFLMFFDVVLKQNAQQNSKGSP